MTDRAHSRPLDPDEARDLAALGLEDSAVRRLPGCPDPALVLALEEGVLEEPIAARVQAHVGACPSCQRAAGDLARMFDEPVSDESRQRVDRLVAAGLKEPSPRRRLEAWLLPAGGLALAAAIALIVVLTRPSPPVVPETQIAQASPPPTVFVVDRPTLPQPDVDLTVRGADTKPSLDNQIAAALDLADAGEVTTAIARLDALVRAQTRSRHAALALGATELRAGRNDAALAMLDRARGLKSDPESREEVDWFLSIALVRTGNRDRARPLLDSLCKGNGARASRACAGLAEIDRPVGK